MEPSPRLPLTRLMQRVVLWCIRRSGEDREAGDVPGWVMVTLMSALLVAAVYAVAGPALVDMFDEAIGKVSGLK